MSKNKIYVYHKDKFKEFYDKYSYENSIISISLFFDFSSNFQEDYFEEYYFKEEKLFIDITAMLKLITARKDIIMYYEILISNIYQKENIDFIVEDSYVDVAFETFPEYFLEKEYLTSVEEATDEKGIVKDISNHPKNIIVYNKDNFNKFIDEKKDGKIEVLSITKIITEVNVTGYSFDLGILSKEKKYVLDITSMIKLSKVRCDLIMSFEILLNELSKFSNVDFAIDADSKDDCKRIFKYSFKEYIEISNVTDKKDKYKVKKIVDMTNEEIEMFIKKFNEELFGHFDFKKDFKKQIKKYKILNKMKEEPIFSMFLCGDSGIGKTEVARIIHKNLYPGSKEIKINFGNYTERGSLWSLIGSPKGFYGSEKGGELTNKIFNSDSKVILIDEFEKADDAIFNFFYELLEDGKYTDLDENQVDLDGYIIIFTSNLNESNYNKKIPESLFSRLSMRYVFVPLSDKDKKDFVNYRTEQLINRYNKAFNTNIEEKDLLLSVDVSDLNNLRDINIRLTDKFIELVE